MSGIKIQNVSAKPGQIVYGSLNMDNVPIPIILVCGKAEGEKLVIQCAQHDAEFGGSAMIGSLLAKLDPETMRGQIIILPLCNIPGILRDRTPDAYDKQYAEIETLKGTDGYNINRTWPGKQNGTFLERFTYMLANEVFTNASAILDYHSCRICDPNFTEFLEGHTKSRELAKAFGITSLNEASETSAPGQCHIEIAKALDLPTILIEMAPTARTIQWSSIQIAEKGAFNIMKHLDMIDGDPEVPATQIVFHRNAKNHSFTASKEGFVTRYRDEAELVNKGDLIAEIRSLEDFSVLESFTAPSDGGAANTGGPTISNLIFPGEDIASFQENVEVIQNTCSSENATMHTS